MKVLSKLNLRRLERSELSQDRTGLVIKQINIPKPLKTLIFDTWDAKCPTKFCPLKSKIEAHDLPSLNCSIYFVVIVA